MFGEPMRATSLHASCSTFERITFVQEIRCNVLISIYVFFQARLGLTTSGECFTNTYVKLVYARARAPAAGADGKQVDRTSLGR